MRRNITKKVLVGIAALAATWSLAFGISTSAQAATYYVDASIGKDTNPGTASQPYRTITFAYNTRAAAGVTILVMPGVYTDYQSGWGLHLNKVGNATSPIILKSQVKGTAIIDGQNASDRNEAIYLDGSYNVIDGFEIKGGPKGGISIWGSFNQILNNDIHNNGNTASSSTNGQDGVYSDESTQSNSYIANAIHDNGRTGSNLDHGLYLCGDNEVVINNLLISNAAFGLQIAGYTTVTNMKVYNNVLAFNGKSGIIFWMVVSGVDIKNNIIFQNKVYGIDSYDAHGSGVNVDHNLVYGNPSGNYNFTRDGSDYSYTLGTTVSSNPLFLSLIQSAYDFHLGANSPAINAGLNLSSAFTTDKDGSARPASGAWEIGAYESGSPIGQPHPADINGDFHLTLNEATKHSSCWKSAPVIPNGCPNPAATVGDAVRAATLWNSTSDGRYHFNSTKTCPLCWEVTP